MMQGPEESEVEKSWAELQDCSEAEADHSEAPICGECDVQQSDDGEGWQVPKGLPEPTAPSRDLQLRHQLTHWPYANWCPFCVMGRRNNSPHFQARNGDARSLPLLVLDYCFIRSEQDQDLVTLLVGKLYPFRKTFACVVDMKGRGTDGYAISRMTEFIRQSGLTKFVFKTDQESSIKALMEETIQKDADIKTMMDEAIRRSGRQGDHIPLTAVPENSAVGASASNGRAERTVQTVEDQLRVLKAAFESRIGAKVPGSHPVIRWLVEHVADIINKYAITRNGMSPHEELHGKKAQERRIEFGERVFFSTPKKGRAKMDLRWRLGIYLGHAPNSNELFVGVANGNVIKARSAVRVVEKTR